MPFLTGPGAQHPQQHAQHSFSAHAACHAGQMGPQSASRFQGSSAAFNAVHPHMAYSANSTQNMSQRPLSAPSGMHVAVPYGHGTVQLGAAGRGPVPHKHSAPAQLHSGHPRGPAFQMRPQHHSSGGAGCSSNILPHSQMHAGSRQSAPQVHSQHQQLQFPPDTQQWQAHRRPHSVSAPAWGSHGAQTHMQQQFHAQGYMPSQQQPGAFMGRSQPAQRLAIGTPFRGGMQQAPASLMPSGHMVSEMAAGNSGVRPHSAAGSAQTNLSGSSAHTNYNTANPRSHSAPAHQRFNNQAQADQPVHAPASQTVARPGSAQGTQTWSRQASVATQEKEEQAAQPGKPAGRDLTEEQQAVVSRVMDWNDYVLVMGLPGAGKTTTIAAIVQVCHCTATPSSCH